MGKILGQVGHVAYFDILGYSKMNCYEDVIRIWRVATNKHRAIVMALIPQGRYHLFGDSILVFYPEILNENYEFLLVCQLLFLTMFKSGLPVRGAIASGEFFQDKTIWAGKPIVDAHRCAERLGASACVATTSALPLVQKSGLFSAMQSVRMKRPDSQEDFHVLTYLEVFSMQQIRSEFLKHGKTADTEVEKKMQSTLELMKAVGTRSKV